MKALIMIIVAVLSISFCSIEAQAGSNTERLIISIRQQQQAAENQIVQMWMSGKRDKEFEVILSDYVAREVRYRAMTGETNTGSLLSEVNKDKDAKLDKPIQLGRLIVLEYFKRKGINLKDKSFVKGTYQIGLR
jgi:ABC-type microcin C transport system permease subunit YejB